MIEVEFENLVPCIPLERSEYCGQSSFLYALNAINVKEVESQEELRRFVEDKTWGTQPHEQENMALAYLPKSHILVKTNWKIDELEEILKSTDAIAVINIHDDFVRIAKGGKISADPPDGHYLNVWTFITAFKNTPRFNRGDELNADVSSSFGRGNRGLKPAEDVIEMEGRKYAVVVDGSTEKIMEGHNGVLHTKYEGVYLITTDYLESIWHDILLNGSENFHWAMVLISRDADPIILEKYRNQGKIT